MYCPGLRDAGIVKDAILLLAYSRSVAAHSPDAVLPASATLNQTALEAKSQSMSQQTSSFLGSSYLVPGCHSVISTPEGTAAMYVITGPCGLQAFAGSVFQQGGQLTYNMRVWPGGPVEANG